METRAVETDAIENSVARNHIRRATTDTNHNHFELIHDPCPAYSGKEDRNGTAKGNRAAATPTDYMMPPGSLSTLQSAWYNQPCPIFHKKCRELRGKGNIQLSTQDQGTC